MCFYLEFILKCNHGEWDKDGIWLVNKVYNVMGNVKIRKYVKLNIC